jgi:hypothetical protein
MRDELASHYSNEFSPMSIKHSKDHYWATAQLARFNVSSAKLTESWENPTFRLRLTDNLEVSPSNSRRVGISNDKHSAFSRLTPGGQSEADDE